MGSHNRYKERICAKEGEGISVVKRGKGRSKGVHPEAVKEVIYLTI